jgi:hypothetical protein
LTIDLDFPLPAVGDEQSSNDCIVSAFESGIFSSFQSFATKHVLVAFCLQFYSLTFYPTGILGLQEQLNGRSMALAVIDHIVSTTAIVVPIERVIRVLRKV